MCYLLQSSCQGLLRKKFFLNVKNAEKDADLGKLQLYLSKLKGYLTVGPKAAFRAFVKGKGVKNKLHKFTFVFVYDNLY